jgi:cold-inducible RNA-binding protein
MPTNIYVGNLPFNVSVEEVRDLFEAHGTVESVNLITDRETGRLRGFGFVEKSTDEEASAAIASLHGSQCQGRTLTVNEARPRPQRDGGGPRGGGPRDRPRW